MNTIKKDKNKEPDFYAIKYNPNKEKDFYNTVLLNKTNYKEYKKELFKLHKKLFTEFFYEGESY